MSTEDTIPFEDALEALRVVDAAWSVALISVGIHEDDVAEIQNVVYDTITGAIEFWPTDG